MRILSEIDLKNYTTFGNSAIAKQFTIVSNTYDVLKLLKKETPAQEDLLILGQGSNVLFTDDFNGLVVKNSLRGISRERQDAYNVFVKAGSGELWQALVNFCVENEWSGIENLSMIPGTVGAAPIQNIGAYGAELKNILECVDAIDLETREKVRFSNEECRFGYRTSIFKEELKNRFFITSITVKLKLEPEFNITYPGVREELGANAKSPTVKAIADAISAIRTKKLPDPKEYGNAGSFFKNPIISMEKFEELSDKYSGLKLQKTGENVKLQAAQLIELAGYKGKRVGKVGTHAVQPLVIINYGYASGKEILEFSKMVQEAVYKKFDIRLEPEVNIF